MLTQRYKKQLKKQSTKPEMPAKSVKTPQKITA